MGLLLLSFEILFYLFIENIRITAVFDNWRSRIVEYPIMAPSELEAFNSNTRRWVRVGKVKPGDQPGSLSNNKPDGSREIIFLDVLLTICRLLFGVLKQV